VVGPGHVDAPGRAHGRRTVLQLTEAGAGLRDRFRDKYRQTFEHITRDWAERDRLELIRLLLRCVDAGDALRSRA
jgi:DNA-binding MarR family transcriptional regulator